MGSFWLVQVDLDDPVNDFTTEQLFQHYVKRFEPLEQQGGQIWDACRARQLDIQAIQLGDTAFFWATQRNPQNDTRGVFAIGHVCCDPDTTKNTVQVQVHQVVLPCSPNFNDWEREIPDLPFGHIRQFGTWARLTDKQAVRVLELLKANWP